MATPRGAPWVESTYQALAGSPGRLIVSALALLLSVGAGVVIEVALHSWNPWASCSAFFLILLVVSLVGFHRMRVGKESDANDAQDKIAELDGVIKDMAGSSNRQGAEIAELETALKKLEARAARERVLRPTVLHMGFRWSAPEHGGRNIPHCADCHSKGRLFPLEKHDEKGNDKIGLECMHSDHAGKSPMLFRDRREFEVFESTYHTKLKDQGSP